MSRTGGAGDRMALRLFRLASRLLPDWFRREYGDAMLDDFATHLGRIEDREGRGSAWAFVVRSVGAIPVQAVRLRSRRARSPSGGMAGAGWRDDSIAAARSLLRSPGWTGACLAILSLGIGGTAALFSVTDAILLRPLPYEEPDRLVSLWTVNRVQDLKDGSSWENAMDWRDRTRALDDVTLVVRPEFTTGTVSSFGRPERIHAGLVDERFFDLLGVRAVTGRTFAAGDLEGDGRVAVMRESLWTDRWARSREAVGSMVTVDGVDWRIVGVVPDEVTIPRRDTGLWLLVDFRSPEDGNRRGSDSFWVLGRLTEGAEPVSAQRELTAVASELEARHPDTNRNRGVRVTGLQDEIVGDRIPLLLWTLLGSMALVLFVGGANVAQLMIGRGVRRRREIAVRASLGASRARVHRQLLFESVLLSLGAGIGGALLAAAGLRSLLWIIPPDVPLVERAAVDGPVLLVCFAVAGVLAPLVGLLPALTTSRVDAAALLRSGGRSGIGREERRLRSALVVGEVAMAVVLLAGAGLMLRSVAALTGVDPGFDARHTLMARVYLSPIDPSEVRLVADGIAADLHRLPGVEGVSRIGAFFVERIPDQTIRVVGAQPRAEGVPAPRLTTDMVAPGFFSELGVPLLRGRSLEWADRGDPAGPLSVVVNRAWVETFADGRDPVGLQFRWGDQDSGPAHVVVGVVGDLRRSALEEVAYPQMFISGVERAFEILVRTEGDPRAVAADVRTIVAEADPGAAVSSVGTAWERYGDGMAQRSFQTFLFGLFSALATLLAAVGLFAVLHEAVSSRRREIGIRLALGAAPREVRGTVVRRGLTLSLLGVGLGLVATVALSDVLGRMVYSVSSTDPATLLGVAAGVLVVAALASVVPALQATRVPPSETLTAH